MLKGRVGGTDSTVTIKPDENFQYLLWEIKKISTYGRILSGGFTTTEFSNTSEGCRIIKLELKYEKR